MKIFLAEGRLGNQLFQYAFLKTIAKKNELIIVFGFQELKQTFNLAKSNFIIINNKNIITKITIKFILKPVFNLLSKLRIISSLSVIHEKILDNKYRRETTDFNKSFGLLKNIMFVKLGFFQSEKFFNQDSIKNLTIKNNYVSDAITFLKNIPNNYHKVFIHIRRGDYKSFKVYGKSTLLPMSYYHNQVKWFLQNRDNCYFIFLSDEVEFIEQEFKYLENKIISNNNFAVDFAIMTLCNSAILSPSSFSWWGSYLMQDRDTIFAPKYWLGFNSGVEYHKNSIPKYIEKICIEAYHD
jgi:hypothetical protein